MPSMGFLQETQSVKHCTAVYSRCMADMLLSIVIYAYQSARVQWGLGSIFTPLSHSRAFCQNCCRKDEETDVYTGLKIYTIYLLTQEKLCSYDKCYKYFISMIRDSRSSMQSNKWHKNYGLCALLWGH